MTTNPQNLGALFVDDDGDVCINDGRQYNLVFCTAYADSDGTVLCPDVVAEVIRRYNAYPTLHLDAPLRQVREAIATIFAEDDPFIGIGDDSYDKADRVLALLAAEAAGRAEYARGLRDAAEKLRGQGYGTAVRQILAMIPEGE